MPRCNIPQSCEMSLDWNVHLTFAFTNQSRKCAQFPSVHVWVLGKSITSVYMRLIGSSRSTAKSSTFMASGMTDALSSPSPSPPRPDDPHQPERRHHPPGVIISAATYRFVLCAALNSCNLGYDIGVSTEAGRLLQTDLGLSNRQREIFIGSINFWASYVLACD
jgi:hypothetical protein